MVNSGKLKPLELVPFLYFSFFFFFALFYSACSFSLSLSHRYQEEKKTYAQQHIRRNTFHCECSKLKFKLIVLFFLDSFLLDCSVQSIFGVLFSIQDMDEEKKKTAFNCMHIARLHIHCNLNLKKKNECKEDIPPGNARIECNEMRFIV